MPMALYSFFEEYDFSGKAIVSFVTSGGSAFSDSIHTIGELEPGAEVLEGLSIGASGVIEEENVQTWLEGLSL